VADSFDPTSRRPVNVDPPTWLGDDRCLDLIEGRLSAADEARELGQLPPEMRRMVELMRRDRAVMMSVGDEHAPAGLVAGVMARLEREMLFEEPSEHESRALRDELEQIAPGSGSSRTNVRRGAEPASYPFPPAAARSGGPVRSGGQGRYALAAGLALVIGGGLFMVMTGTPTVPMARSWQNELAGGTQGGTTAGTMAGTQAGTTAGGQGGATTPAPTPSGPETPTVVAQETTNSGGTRGMTTDVTTPTTAPTTAPTHTVATASTNQNAAELGHAADVHAGELGNAATATLAAGVPSGPIGIERAMELAREGRLAIRIVASDPRDAAARVGQLAQRKPDPRRMWRLTTADEQTTRLATVGIPTRDQVERKRDWDLSFARLMAGEVEMSPPVAIDGTPRRVAYDPRQDGGVFVLDAALTPQALGLVKSTLRVAGGAGAEGRIEFVELDEATSPSSSAESVMWWTQPTTSWVARAAIPVVVEAK
jgi:hypothetical protein